MKFKNVKIFYALMIWGGITPGQRPRTALFKIYKRSEDEQHFKAARIDVFGNELTKNLTTLARSNLVKGWVSLPPRGDIHAARRTLRVCPNIRIEIGSPSDSLPILSD